MKGQFVYRSFIPDKKFRSTFFFQIRIINGRLDITSLGNKNEEVL